MRIFKVLQKSTKDELINMLYNDFIANISYDDDGNKLIPYVWYWQSVDFAGRNITICKTDEYANGINENYIGITQENRWGYPERKLTDEEVDTFIGFIDKAIMGSKNKTSEELGKLNNWIQSLVI